MNSLSNTLGKMLRAAIGDIDIDDPDIDDAIDVFLRNVTVELQPQGLFCSLRFRICDAAIDFDCCQGEPHYGEEHYCQIEEFDDEAFACYQQWNLDIEEQHSWHIGNEFAETITPGC